MSFISWEYTVLLTGVFAHYWQLAWRGRLWLLLGASCFFYGAWDVRFLALLPTSTAVVFYCGLAIAGERRPTARIALTSGATRNIRIGHPVDGQRVSADGSFS